MRIKTSLTSAAKLVGVGLSASFMVVGIANAEPNDNKLVVDGKTLTTKVKGKKDGPLDEVYSGWRFRTSQTQKFQTDDFENPGFPLVDLAEGLWGKVEGTKGKACVSCHQDAATSMKGVRAAMPKWHEAAGKPQALEQHITHTLGTAMVDVLLERLVNLRRSSSTSTIAVPSVWVPSPGSGNLTKCLA